MTRFPKGCRLLLFALMCCVFSLSSRAQWTSDPSVNTLITGSSKVSASFQRRAISDGNGGMFVLWIDDDSYQGHIQRLDASGVVKWTAGGIQLGSSVSTNTLDASLVSDGGGGVLVGFNQVGRGILVQRFNSAGVAQWASDGIIISATLNEGHLELAGDGSGGAIIAYEINSDIYAQRINASGTVLWGSGGVPVTTATNTQGNHFMVADGQGGAIMAWTDSRNMGTNGFDIYAQRIDPNGNTLWANNGVGVAVLPQNHYDPKLAADGNGGVFIAWTDYSAVDIQHIDPTGNLLWGTNGKPVENTASAKTAYNLVGDNSGGMYITWTTTTTYDIYAQHFNSAGAELWTANGNIVCNATNVQHNADLLVDGAGAVLMAWQDARSGTANIYAQKLAPNGTAYWTANGVLVSNADLQTDTKLVLKTGSNNAIVWWLDYRNGNSSLYAQVLAPSGGLAEIPAVTGFTPATGATGTSVTISGTGFATTPANNIVYFGAVKATVTQAAYGSLTVTVPAGATAEPISVQNALNKLQAKSQNVFRTQYTNAREIGQFDMRKPVIFNSGGQTPTQLTYADVDGDGKTDLLGIASAQFIAFRNTSSAGSISSGSLAARQVFTIPGLTFPQDIQTEDLDGDGKKDVVIPDYITNKLYLLKNTSTPGTISFAAAVEISVSGVFHLALSDIDGDGWVDIAITDYSYGISIFRNLGTGTIGISSFAAAFNISVPGALATWFLKAGDLDGDGKADIVVTDGNANDKLYIFRNTGTPGIINSSSFAAAVTLTVSNTPISVSYPHITDIDGDGKPDIAFENYSNSNQISIFRNNGTPGAITPASFDTRVDLPALEYSSGFRVGDVNGDGKPDLVVSNFSQDKIQLFQNIGTTGTITSGSFTSSVEFTSQNSFYQVYSLAAIDIDGDGRQDLVGGMSSNLGILHNSPLLAPSTQASNIIFTPTTPSSINIGWTNGDGEERTVFMKANNAGTFPLPVNGTVYSTSTVFGAGGQIGSSGWFAVYSGAGNTVAVANLSGGITYSVMVLEKNNNGYTTQAMYQTATATNNPANFAFPATLSSITTVGTQLTNAATADFDVQFDSPVTGLTTGNFALTTTGAVSGASVVSVTSTAAPEVYRVSVNTGTGSGTIALQLVNATGLFPSLSNTLPFTDQAYDIDKDAPLLTTTSISSNNALSSAFATTGNIITLQVAKPADAVSATALINGINITPTLSGGSYRAALTVTSGMGDGMVAFSMTVRDAAGNTSTTTTVTSGLPVTIDKTAPAISGVSLNSNNATLNRAKPGHTVTLGFVTNEAGPTPTAIIAAHPVSVTNTGGNNWQATYTINNTDTDGLIAYTISAKDLAGNTAVKSTSDDGSFVLLDKTIPVIGNLTLVSGNAITGKAKAGNNVTLKFTATESINTPTALIASHLITATNTGSNNWQAVYTMSNTDTEGNIAFSLRVTDLAGNQSITATTTSNDSKVVFDKTAPVLDSIKRQLPLMAAVSTGPVTYRVFFSEPVTGVLKNKFAINKTGTANAAVDSVTAVNDSTYDVKLVGLAGNGTIRLDLTVFASVNDSTGNAMTGAFTTGALYSIITSVNAAPVFDAGAVTNFTVCQDAAAHALSSLLKTKDNDNGQTLSWTISGNPSHGILSGFPATITSNTAWVTPENVTYTPDRGYNGADQFTIDVSDGTATASISVNVNINTLPSATITATQGTTLCGNNAAVPLSVAGGVNYEWRRNGALLGSNSNQLIATAAGTYTVLVTDANGCVAPASNSIIVTTVQQPKAAFTFSGYCANVPIVINNQSTATGTVSYQWSDGNGNGSASASPSFTYTQPGSYTIKLKIGSSDCPSQHDSTTQVINIEKPAAAIRMPTLNVPVMQPVVLQARNIGSSYLWTPGADLSNATISNPVVKPGAERQYTVSIKSAAGCVTVDTLLVKVFENNLYVPKVFTPNGDGQNDVLYFNFINVSKLEYIRIFNRQGKRVFETTNMSEGWDGKLNGVLQPLESYVWVVKAIDMNGHLVARQGMVTLLR